MNLWGELVAQLVAEVLHTLVFRDGRVDGFDQAAQELGWSKNNDDLKVIIIAGNESFAQGSLSYRLACKTAIEQGITQMHARQHAGSLGADNKVIGTCQQ